MILFKEQHMKPIQRGAKTQTRRLWDTSKPSRAKKGSVHLAKTLMLSKFYFARLEILDAHTERLGDITPEDAMKEGGYTVQEFKSIWTQINGSWDPDLEVYVVEFKCIPNVDLRVGDKVQMSPECAEYLIYKDTIWTVDRASYRIGFSELANLIGFSGGFSTKFLEKV